MVPDHRPRSPAHWLAILLCLFPLTFSVCQPRRNVTLALLGDINLGRGVRPSADTFGFLTPHLRAADLALANLESPLSSDPPARKTGDGYNLCAPAAPAEILAEWGLDLLSIANNHRFDCGSEGPSETSALLEEAGLTAIGLADEAVVRQVDGLTLAFLAFDDLSFPLDAGAAAQSIRAAREDGALVIVSVHWGAEYQAAPTNRQQALARQFAAAGATLIWGHHPHVLQPAVWLETEQGKTLVFYSLGNALFDQHGMADTRRSALALVTLGEKGVTKVNIMPFEIDVVHSRVTFPAPESGMKIRKRVGVEEEKQPWPPRPDGTLPKIRF